MPTNRQPKTRRTLYLLLALLIVGGLSYAFSQTQFLKGTVTGFEDISSMDVEEAASYAESYSEEAGENLADATTAASEAEAAFTSYDRDALETAQEDAQTAADSADLWAERAQEAADQAESEYEALLSTMENTLESACRGETCGETTCTDSGACSVVCTYDYDTDDPEYGLCVDALDTQYEEEYYPDNKGGFPEDDQGYNYYVARQAYEDAATFVEAANTAAEAASDYAIDAQSYANLAASYSLLTCSGLTLSPDSYEMAAEDIEAAFDLTVTIATGEAEETATNVASPLAKNLMAFVLTEIEEEVKIEGVIEATRAPETYETQEAWGGTLEVKAAGYGEFTYGTSTDNPLEIDLTEAGDVTVSVAGAVEGDTIEVSIEDEETLCSTSLTITQAAEIPTIEDTERDLEDITVLNDEDGDGLTDDEEVETYGTDFRDEDSDDDGLTDYEEVITHLTDPNNSDSDSDGTSDYDEVAAGTDPLVDESAEDTTDTDGDGLTDTEESTYGTDASDADSDDDGLSDYEEVMTYLTDPTDSDTDGGGVGDYDEVVAGTDPLDSTDDVSEETAEVTTEVPETTYDIIRSKEYVCTDPFEDTHGQWYEDLVCRAFQAELIIGRTDTTFVGGDNMTRAEWIKVMTLVFGFDVSDAAGLESNFDDVSSSSDWFFNYIVIAENEDVIRTRDSGTNFNPNEPITRADAILYAIRYAGLTDYDYDVEGTFSDVSNDDYYAYALAIAKETTVTLSDGEVYSVIEGYEDGTFRPYDNILRSEAMAIAIRVAVAWGVASEEVETEE